MKNKENSNEIIHLTKGLDKLFTEDSGHFNLEVNIHAIRIVYRLAYHLKKDQWLYKNNTNQYREKFEENLITDHNDFYDFQFKLSEMGINNNYNEVKKAFNFLAHYKTGWHKSISQKGKKVETLFGFINNPTFSEGGYVMFRVPRYWMKELLKIGESGFNQSLYSLPFNTSKTKHFYFHYWLLRLPKEGTTINVKLFQDRFSLNYSSNFELDRGFIKKMKVLMDKYSNISFNYSFENTKLRVAKYVNSPSFFNESENEKAIIGLYKDKKRQRIHYLKRRHNLNTEQVKVLKDNINNYDLYRLFEESYSLLKLKCKENDLKLTDLEGNVFLEKLQAIINYVLDKGYSNAPDIKTLVIS